MYAPIRCTCVAVAAAVVAAAGSVAAPVPKAGPPTPRLATLKAALGKTHLSKEVRAVMRDLGEYPIFRPGRVRFDDPPGREDDGREDIGFYLRWQTRGVELLFLYGKLVGIYLHAKGEDGYDQYRGELPGGLYWGDDLPTVERKLGPPDKRLEVPNKKIDGKVHAELQMDYDDVKGLRITILLRRPQDGAYALRWVSMGEPKKE